MTHEVLSAWDVVAKFDNPIREKDKSLEWATNELKRYFELEWLKADSVLLASWSDYRIGDKEGFGANEPFVFKNEYGACFARLVKYLDYLKRQAILKEQVTVEHGVGFAEFIYRQSHRKRCVIFERTAENGKYECLTNSDEILHVRVPSKIPSRSYSQVAGMAAGMGFDDFMVARRSEFLNWCSRAEIEGDFNGSLARRFEDRRADALKMDGLDEVVEKHLGEISPEGRKQFQFFLALASITFEVDKNLNAVCYVPGRGFLHNHDTEECSGGLYLWLKSLDPFKSCEIETWKGILVRETIRCLRTSVHDWAGFLNRASLMRQRSQRRLRFLHNFSHVTGSHVISNPNFAEQLVKNGRARLLTDFLAAEVKFEESYKAEVAYEENNGPPPASDRWEPWNAVRRLLNNKHEQLSNPRLDLRAISRFHHYLQARFDFIARSIEETQDQPEPVFFISELFNGFLEQEEFLDTLVADLGVRLADIRFEVRFDFDDSRSSTNFVRTFKHDLERIGEEDSLASKWVSEPPNGDIEENDFLVGLPGGMIAAQAFYSLLENVVRNSVKYQPKSTEKQPYTLTIVVKDADRRIREQKGNPHADGRVHSRDLDNRYLIAIHDNWSTGETAYVKVAQIIETPLVSAEGKPERSGLGVQEMKLCAESLVAGDFKSSLNRTELGGNNIVAKGRLRDPHQNLQIATGKLTEPLTFLLELEEPVLLALVTNAATGEGSSRGIIRVSDNVKSLGGKNAHFLVVDARKQDKLAEYLDESKDRNHRLLPGRILVLGNGSAELQGDLEPWVKRRRVHFLRCTTSYDLLFNSQISNANSAEKNENANTEFLSSCCTIGWHDWWIKKDKAERTQSENDKLRILIASVAWLRAYKANEREYSDDSIDQRCVVKPWLLCLGFERSHSQVANAWEGILDDFNRHSDLIKVIVRSSPKGENARTVKGSYSDSSLSFDENDSNAFINTPLNLLDESIRRRLLVFDNHGRCFGKKWSHDAENECDYRNSVRYFQTFSGSTADLYRILSRPPKTMFGFSFLIHSLVESCLTNVAIVDERLAGDLMFGDAADGTTGNDFDKRIATHQKSGVFPVFRVTPTSSENTLSREGHYTPKHKSAFEKLVTGENARRGEGIEYSQISNEGGKCDSKSKLKALTLNNDKQLELEESLNCDVLIVHEGAFDILQGEDGIDWKRTNDRCLYEIAPIVCRTSGRGRETKNFQNTVPFVEFHIVSSAVLTSRNKYSLVRGVYGATGQDLEG